MKKWVKMITDSSEKYLTEENEMIFLDFKEEDIDTRFTFQELQGADGSLPGVSSFAPFKLILRFAYVGEDIQDYHLFKARLRNTIYTRTPFYLIHSDMPFKKYAVLTESTSIENRFGKNGEFEITFNVYKGYSESVYETDKYKTISDNWQFGNGLYLGDDIKYKHNTSSFKIFNGSSDYIEPEKHKNKLKININIDAPSGFILHNKTTGDKFEYKKAIKYNSKLIIDGIYPTINGNRVGVDTNHEWLTLAPGYNDIEIIGENLNKINIEFIFPFIYR